MDKGHLVPDEIVVGIIAERIEQADCKNGFILDGFPRTVNQAKALDGMLKGKTRGVDVVIVMEVDEAALIKRVENRAAEARRKGEPVRPDDDPEIFKKRLAVYKAETAPILPVLRGPGENPAGRRHEVDRRGDRPDRRGPRLEAPMAGKGGKAWLAQMVDRVEKSPYIPRPL